MRKIISSILVFTLVVAVTAAIFPLSIVQAKNVTDPGKFVVANRGSGTISVLDAVTADLIGTYALPQAPGENNPQPMYVVYIRSTGKVYVGDRGNDRVVVFDPDTFSVEGTIPTGSGVFHMWADPKGVQLWVNNDIDNTTTVIDPRSMGIITTVLSPADLVAMGGKPHDVILDPSGLMAYVSFVGVAGDYDYVVQFSTLTFEELGRVAVGKDPHLSLTWRNNYLYVASQGGNSVTVFDRSSLGLIKEISVLGAHGAGMTQSGRYFYTTNLPGGGFAGLWTISTVTNQLVGEPVDTPYAVPHNIALTPIQGRLFVTHSGPSADRVSIYEVSERNPVPTLLGEVTVGLNPFGIAYVP